MKPILTSILVLALAAPALADGLKMGDPAPDLRLGQWTQGDAIAPADRKGKIIGVCFWSSSCEDCPDVMAELSSIQQRLGPQGVVIIGVSDDEAGTIRSFVKRNQAKVTFRIAIDQTDRGDAGSAVEGDGLTRAAYYKPFGVNEVPYAFIIDRSGRLAWRGHPLINNMEDVLESIVNNKWDAVRRGMLEDYFALIRAGDAAKAKQIGEALVKSPGEDPDIPCTLSLVITRTPDVQTPDYDLGLRAAQLAYKALPNDARVLGAMGLAHAKLGQLDEGIKYLSEAVGQASDPYNKAGLTKELKRLEVQKARAAAQPAAGTRRK